MTGSCSHLGGAFPTFPNGATLAQKKQLISEFIGCEKDRKVVKICKELLKGQLIKAIDENFILEFKDDMMDYDGVPLIKLLRHLRNEYVPQDVDFLEKVLKESDEPPDLTNPIDMYFAKQERCQRLLANSEDPIEERTMVVKATQYFGKDPSLAKKTVQFQKPNKNERTWVKCKAYYRKVLCAVKQEQKCLGADPGYQARRRGRRWRQKCLDPSTHWRVRPLPKRQLSTATPPLSPRSAKPTPNSWRQTNAWLRNSPQPNCPFSPLGFQPVIPATPYNPAGTGKGVSYENLATVDTGHKNNTTGVSCPAVKKSNNK